MIEQLHEITGVPVMGPERRLLSPLSKDSAANLEVTRQWLEKASEMVHRMQEHPEFIAPRKISNLIRVLTEAEEDIDSEIEKLEEDLVTYEKEEEAAHKKVEEAAAK